MKALLLALALCCPEPIAAPSVTVYLEPPVQLQDLGRFPGPYVVEQNLVLAREHIAWLKEQTRAEGDPRFWDWLEEAETAEMIWSTLDAAQCPCDPECGYTDECRLGALLALREMLGRNYWIGLMPPPVPLHRFRGLAH